jgi:hypothetical protein
VLIEAYGTVYAGTKIRIGQTELEVENDLEGVHFYKTAKGIEWEEF